MFAIATIFKMLETCCLLGFRCTRPLGGLDDLNKFVSRISHVQGVAVEEEMPSDDNGNVATVVVTRSSRQC